MLLYIYIESKKLCDDYYKSNAPKLFFDYIHVLVDATEWKPIQDLVHSGTMREIFINDANAQKELVMVLVNMSTVGLVITKEDAAQPMTEYLKRNQGFFKDILNEDIINNELFDLNRLIDPDSYQNRKWTDIDTGDIEWIGTKFEKDCKNLKFKDDITKKYYQQNGDKIQYSKQKIQSHIHQINLS